MSWLRLPKSWASVSLPFSLSNRYGFLTCSQGNSRRSRLSSSRRRLNSFSLARKLRRAASHSSCDTIRWSVMFPLLSFTSGSALRHPLRSRWRGSPRRACIDVRERRREQIELLLPVLAVAVHPYGGIEQRSGVQTAAADAAAALLLDQP